MVFLFHFVLSSGHPGYKSTAINHTTFRKPILSQHTIYAWYACFFIVRLPAQSNYLCIIKNPFLYNNEFKSHTSWVFFCSFIHDQYIYLCSANCSAKSCLFHQYCTMKFKADFKWPCMRMTMTACWLFFSFWPSIFMQFPHRSMTSTASAPTTAVCMHVCSEEQPESQILSVSSGLPEKKEETYVSIDYADDVRKGSDCQLDRKICLSPWKVFWHA